MRKFQILFILLMPAAVLAQDLVEFENGKVANADDINANFNTLIDAIQTIENSPGAVLLTGENAPDPSLGQVGDIYLDTTEYRLYGPKQVIGWGVGKSLVGPPGDSSAGTGADCSALLCELSGNVCENPLASYDSLNLAACNLAGEDLSGLSFPLASLTNANLMNTDLTGSDLSGSNLESADVRGAAAEGMTGSILQGKGVDAENANFASAILAGSNFKGGNFTQATLTGADLSGVNFDRATLEQIEGAGSQLQNASLIATNMESANLAGANLSQSDLTGSSLENASLTGASFEGAVLTGVNLSSANLTSANLVGADIEGVDWTDSVCPSGDVATGACASSAGVCGDGITDPNFGEECDPGNPDDSDICTQTCESIATEVLSVTLDASVVDIYPPEKVQVNVSSEIRSATSVSAQLEVITLDEQQLPPWTAIQQEPSDPNFLSWIVEFDTTTDFAFGTVNGIFRVVIEDELGNSDTGVATADIRQIDTIAPVINRVTVDPDRIIILASNSYPTQVSVSMDVTDNDPDRPPIVIGTVGGAQQSHVSLVNNTYTYLFSLNPLDPSDGLGTRYLFDLLVTASDHFNNQTEVTIPIVMEAIDDVGPVISTIIAGDFALRDSQQFGVITVRAVISDPYGVDYSSVSSSETEATFIGITGSGEFTWNWSITSYDYPLGVTSDSFTINAADESGNVTSAETSFSVTVIDDLTPAIASVGLSNESVFVTESTTANVQLTASVNDNRGISSVTATSDLPIQLQGTSGAVYQWGITVPGATLPEGQNVYPIQIEAIDTSGNLTSRSVALTVNNGPS